MDLVNMLKILICFIANVYIVSSTTRNQNLMTTTRTLYSLTNESKAIMSDTIDYNSGQLSTMIPTNYIHIIKRPYPVTCGPYFEDIAKSFEKSTCPWKFQKNIDNNRKPREITEAVCRVRNTAVCGTTTASLQIIRNGCVKHACREVKYYTYVLRRHSQDPNDYIKVLEPISAGCTCMCTELKPPPMSRGHRICN